MYFEIAYTLFIFSLGVYARPTLESLWNTIKRKWAASREA